MNRIMVKKAAETYHRIARDFPALKKTLQAIGFGADNSCGFAPNGYMFLSLDGDIWKDEESLSSFFEKVKEFGHTRNASDPMFIMAHELGHALDNTLALKRIGAGGRLTIEKMSAFSKAKKENAQKARAAFRGDLSDEEMDDYFDWIDEREGACNKLLGHSDNIQGGMELECEYVTNGIYCGDPSGYQQAKKLGLHKNAARWSLLMQVESNEELGMMWGDLGRLYLWITDEDLNL